MTIRNTAATSSEIRTTPTTTPHAFPGIAASTRPTTRTPNGWVRRAAAVLFALTIASTTACGSSAAAHRAPARTAPAAFAGSAAAATPPCHSTADSVQHWSTHGADVPACLLRLRQQAIKALGVTGGPTGVSGTWICPTTPDAAEHWVRSLGVATCRR
jgi:hypothetical protein